MYLAELQVPEDSPYVLVRPTVTAGHYTVWCCEDAALSFSRMVRPIVGLSA
jgi:hypothetical protein